MKPKPAARLRARLSAALLLLAPPAPARAQQAPAHWQAAWDFLVQTVCADAQGRLLPGISPLDGPAACPRQRKPNLGEGLPYHKHDWPDAWSRAGTPGGYAESDSFPVQTVSGLAVVQTLDFGDAPRRFGTFDQGDGGQVVFFTSASASIGITEDGGAGLQFFLGPACTFADGWILVDSTFPANSSGETLARITRSTSRCPARLGYAYTRWRVQPVRFRATLRRQPGSAVLTTLVTDHFGGRDPDVAANLERMYFTRELGLTRWERWENLSVHDSPRNRRMAEQIARTGRCEPGLGTPSAASGWVMTDCREWTQVVPPRDPAGDPPTFWLDRLRAAPETRAAFPP